MPFYSTRFLLMKPCEIELNLPIVLCVISEKIRVISKSNSTYYETILSYGDIFGLLEKIELEKVKLGEGQVSSKNCAIVEMSVVKVILNHISYCSNNCSTHSK